MNEFERYQNLETIGRPEAMDMYMDEGNDALPEKTDPLFASLRAEANVQGGVLLIYHGILNVVVFAVTFAVTMVTLLQQFVNGGGGIDAVLETVMDVAGWGYLLAVTIGVIALLLWKKPAYIRDTICDKGKTMTVGAFFALLTLTMAPQMIAQLSNLGLQWLMQWLGLDLDALESMGSMNTDTVPMFLYVGIAAPITEELLFRGLLMRSIEPYNKKLAILASALLFGLYHGNLIQTPYAVFVGLVLGYVAMEYHVIWAIALHMFNNLVFGLLLPEALAFLPDAQVNVILWIMILMFFLGALVILICKRRQVLARWREETIPALQRRAFFDSPTVIILIVICLLNLLGTTLLLFVA